MPIHDKEIDGGCYSFYSLSIIQMIQIERYTGHRGHHQRIWLKVVAYAIGTGELNEAVTPVIHCSAKQRCYLIKVHWTFLFGSPHLPSWQKLEHQHCWCGDQSRPSLSISLRLYASNISLDEEYLILHLNHSSSIFFQMFYQYPIIRILEWALWWLHSLW